MFFKKSVFENFAKFTGRHLCHSLIFNKVDLKFQLKHRFCHSCFPVNFAQFLSTPFLKEHFRWLLLCNPCRTTGLSLYTP